MGKLLRESLARSPVVRFGEYEYFVHPLSDGIPALEPALLSEVVEEICAVADLRGVARIVTVEAMGIPIATALSLRLALPLTIVRKREYGLAGEIRLGQSTGYSKGELFVNGLARGDRVLVVDDVMSTGGTLLPLLSALAANGIEVVDAVVIFEKVGARPQHDAEGGPRVRALQRIDVRDGRVVVL